jgi:hypothetical protein
VSNAFGEIAIDEGGSNRNGGYNQRNRLIEFVNAKNSIQSIVCIDNPIGGIGGGGGGLHEMIGYMFCIIYLNIKS